ncbi:hypothetical protein DFH09DRAFT_1483870 [Mycena vulgaris]|nr:hypothetical protein DFH09DRAFT_1483870 [Mycena vulgaris]
MKEPILRMPEDLEGGIFKHCACLGEVSEGHALVTRLATQMRADQAHKIEDGWAVMHASWRGCRGIAMAGFCALKASTQCGPRGTTTAINSSSASALCATRRILHGCEGSTSRIQGLLVAGPWRMADDDGENGDDGEGGEIFWIEVDDRPESNGPLRFKRFRREMDADAGPPLPGRILTPWSVVILDISNGLEQARYLSLRTAPAVLTTATHHTTGCQILEVGGSGDPRRERIDSGKERDTRGGGSENTLPHGERRIPDKKGWAAWKQTETKRIDAGSRYETQRVPLDQDSISAHWGNTRQFGIDASVAREISTAEVRAHTPEPRRERRISDIPATATVQRPQPVNGAARAYAHPVAKRRRHPQRETPPLHASHRIIIQQAYASVCPGNHAGTRALARQRARMSASINIPSPIQGHSGRPAMPRIQQDAGWAAEAGGEEGTKGARPLASLGRGRQRTKQQESTRRISAWREE